VQAQCKLCTKVGHLARNCPEKAKLKNRPKRVSKQKQLLSGILRKRKPGAGAEAEGAEAGASEPLADSGGAADTEAATAAIVDSSSKRAKTTAVADGDPTGDGGGGVAKPAVAGSGGGSGGGGLGGLIADYGDSSGSESE
jgi:hypothetical protein